MPAARAKLRDTTRSQQNSDFNGRGKRKDSTRIKSLDESEGYAGY